MKTIKEDKIVIVPFKFKTNTPEEHIRFAQYELGRKVFEKLSKMI